MIQLSHLYMTTGKTIAFTRLTFVAKVRSLLFNMLSRLVISFLPLFFLNRYFFSLQYFILSCLPASLLGLQGDPTSPFWRKIRPGISLEGLMLKLKLQYFGHVMRRVDSLEKTLMLGGIGGRRRRGRQRMRWRMASQTRWTRICVNSVRWWWTGRPGVLRFMVSQRFRHDWATELNW